MARPASPPRTAGRVPRSNCTALGATSSSLFIWHDAVAGRGISHKVVIMYLGGTVEVGPKTELFEQKLHPYDKAALSSWALSRP